jgi:ATP-binding cassette subfamily B protein
VGSPNLPPPETNFFESLKNIPALAREVWGASPLLCLLLFIFRTIVAISPVATLAVGGLLIDAVNRLRLAHQGPSRVWHLFTLELAVVLVTNALTRLISHYELLLTDRFSLRMSLKLIDHCNSLDLETLENPRFQDQLQRARSQISSQVSAIRNLLQVAQLFISILCMMCGAILTVPVLIALQFLGAVPIVIVESYFARIRYILAKNRTPLKRMLDYILYLVSGSFGIKEIRLFDTGSFFFEEYRTVAERHQQEDARLSKRATDLALVWVSLSILLYYMAYALLVREAVHGIFTIGRLIFLSGILIGFRTQLSNLFNNLSQGLDQLLYVGDIVEVFGAQPRIKSEEHARPMPKEIQEGFEFRSVSFTYADCVKPAVEDISFKLQPGQVIAFVGENGAGKSTILKLLTRLYDVSSGEILLDGIDIREFSPSELRQHITAVFQDYVKYDLSVSLNISLGDISARQDSDRIKEVANRTGAHGFIASMPLGYDQILGRRFAQGIDLSGGQWQRLALARAYMRSSSLVILDEPTAAVDARAEAALYEDAIRVSAAKMTILVSHRLSTVRSAHRIFVLKGGRICEEGTHEELMAMGGEYAELFILQAKGYM